MAPPTRERKLRTIDDIPIDGKTVIVRADFNVSAGSSGTIGTTEDYRIEAALPTIQELSRRRCKVLLLAHRGFSEDGEGDPDMEPIKDRLEDLLKEEIRTLPKLFGPGVEAVVSSMEPGGIALYPNVRTDDREMEINDRFGQQIAQVADVYISEAFSVCHRAHTSMVVLPRLMVSAAGRRTVLEVTALSKLRGAPQRPYVAIVSGSKIVTKIGMLRWMLNVVDTICVGGQIANVFMAARGDWPVERFQADEIAAARSLLEKAGEKLFVPFDVVIGDSEGRGAKAIAASDIPSDAGGIWDIGPQSTAHIIELCRTAKTVMWNGPVGKFETESYAASTKMLAEGLAGQSAYRVVGGGDTVNALEKYRVAEKYNHVSIGGGAMIAFLEGKRLPGLEPLLQ